MSGADAAEEDEEMATRKQRDVENEIDAIEARPLSRYERDALQASLLVELRAIREQTSERARIQRCLAREILSPLLANVAI